jgi:hypothetical protein
MNTLTRRIAVTGMVLLAATGAARAADWTEPVDIRYDMKRCVSYRARLNGDFLVIQATHEPGWHTIAMDNTRRAAEKLAGKQSLGVDTPTEFKLGKGLEVVGPWYQSPPKDLSKPELQWFTWGFDGQALFVAKVKRAGAGPAEIAISGQACTDTICKKIDTELSLPLAGANTGASAVDLKTLVQVR